jgi:hypothetical protein
MSRLSVTKRKKPEKKKKIQKFGLKGQAGGHSMKKHRKILIMRRRRREDKKKSFLCKIIVNNELQLYM